MRKNGQGFDRRDMDTNVRPQDDFYHHVNGGWLKKNPVPPHESRWGSFLMLRYETEKKLHAIVSRLQDEKNLKAGSAERMIRDFYRSGMDTKRRNALGATPLAPWLERIAKITDVRSLVSVFAHLETIGGGGPWGIAVDQDMKDSRKYVAYLHQSGLGMPDRDYYLKDDRESVRVRTAYVKHLEAIFALMGKTKAEAKDGAKTVMRIETAIAKISMTKEDLRDVDKTYHPIRRAALARLTPAIDWDSFFRIVGARDVNRVILMQPEFFKALDALLVKEPLEDWKTFLSWHLVGGAASYLTARFEKQNFAFYGTTLSGVTKMKPAWRRILASVNGSLGEPLGRLYVQEYFSPEAKRKAARMVEDLFEAYEARIRNLDWMSAATKRKAAKKLRQIDRKLGYPDKWRKYRGLMISPHDYFGNAVRTARFEHARMMRRLKKPVDRSEWFMNPQTVNAYYSFGLNDIVFPAAILQPPFFSVDGDDALNYGAMGSVIGHEITHGFDDQGSKFDGTGNRRTWWTKEDRKRFEKKAEALVRQFNAYTVADGLAVNGRLTLGENIADLGGASIAYDAFRLRLAKTKQKAGNDATGLTPEQRFFFGFALFERENRRPEAEKTQVLTDPHSPGTFRINGPASNLQEFYQVFDVRKGDKLYREPAKRAKVW